MRLLNCRITNFGSYKDFELDFSNQGLVLISGPTGSGKSTIPDIAAWIIFGTTSKDVNSDGVRSWGSTEPTIGEIEISLQDKVYKIHRIRGKASENDLYFYPIESPEPIRGKNILDTQKLINELVQVDAELYFTTSYFHQFSKADSFFTARPNERREVFEKIVDQKVAIELGDKTSQVRKDTKKALEEQKKTLSYLQGEFASNKKTLKALSDNHEKWEVDHQNGIEALKVKANSFETDKNLKIEGALSKIEHLEASKRDNSYFDSFNIAIEALEHEKALLQDNIRKNDTLLAQLESEKESLTKSLDTLVHSEGGHCPICDGELSVEHKETTEADIKDSLVEIHERIKVIQVEVKTLPKINDLDKKIKGLNSQMYAEQALEKTNTAKYEALVDYIEQLSNSKNTYADQIIELNSKHNPFKHQISSMEDAIAESNLEIYKQESNISDTDERLAALNLLYNISFEFRGALLTQVTKTIEYDINACLNTHFEAIMKLRLSLSGSDKVDVEIQKSGNTCTFEQLSGGERRILKLAFWLAVKRAAENKAGKTFSTLCFDESFNGCDDDLKEKAYGLLQELESTHESIFVIEHSESFKTLFNKQFHVKLISDMSNITHVR